MSRRRPAPPPQRYSRTMCSSFLFRGPKAVSRLLRRKPCLRACVALCFFALVAGLLLGAGLLLHFEAIKQRDSMQDNI